MERRTLPVSRLLVDLLNPRYEANDTSEEAYSDLINTDKIIEIARDIVERGSLNPLENIGVYSDEESGGKRFVVLEGNRRICALQLLEDPDSVPKEVPKRASLVQRLKQLGNKGNHPTRVECVVFESREEADSWLDRLHGEPPDGTARRKWDAAQKARASSGTSRNTAALQFLDWAQRTGRMTAEDSQRRITTVQRSIGNPEVRAALGLVGVQNGGLRRVVPLAVFEPRADQLIAELDSTLTSRSGKKQRDAFVAKLLKELGEPKPQTDPKRLDDDTPDDMPDTDDASGGGSESPGGDQSNGGSSGGAQPEGSDDPLDSEDADDSDATGGGGRGTASRPKDKSRLPVFDDLDDALSELGNDKLLSLHASITGISAETHTPLVAIGLWAFIEVLTRAAGRGERVEIGNFHNTFTQADGLARDERKSQRQSLSRVMENGDATKHHAVAMTVDRRQLRNDFEVLRPALVSFAQKAKELKTP